MHKGKPSDYYQLELNTLNFRRIHLDARTVFLTLYYRTMVCVSRLVQSVMSCVVVMMSFVHKVIETNRESCSYDIGKGMNGYYQWNGNGYQRNRNKQVQPNK